MKAQFLTSAVSVACRRGRLLGWQASGGAPMEMSPASLVLATCRTMEIGFPIYTFAKNMIVNLCWFGYFCILAKTA
jgi:hypothetical protein